MSTPADDVLTSDKPGAMNLRAVKTRTADLRRTVDHLLQTLQFAPATLQWPEVLDRFAVINVQLQQLHAQLRPLLQHYVVHPRSVNQTNAPLLPLLLATKLLPEQEAERNALAAAADVAPPSAPSSETFIADMNAAASQLNDIVEALTGQGGLLHPKGAVRGRINNTARAAAVDDSREVEASVAVAAALAFRRGTTSGTGAVEGASADALLAAASYGEGLL